MKLRPENLKESTSFLNLVLDNIVSAVFISNENAEIQSINDSFRNLFAKKEDQIIGQKCGNVFGCEYVINEHKDCGSTSNCSGCIFRSALISTFMTHQPVLRRKMSRRFFIKNKVYQKYFEFTTRFITFQEKDMVLIILDDITEKEEHKLKLQDQNKELIQLNRKKNEFLGMAAHDLRSPVAQIIALTSILKEPERINNIRIRKKILRDIHQQGYFALSVINDFLDFSLIESGKVKLNRKKIQYGNFIKHLAGLNQMLADKKDITIDLQLPDDLPFLHIDKSKIEQVINNLISNAIKFSPGGSQIEIRIKSDGKQVFTFVNDQGTGISEELQKKLFDPLQKITTPGTDGEKGTGLGLLISKQVVESHGGAIGFSGNAQGGSSFWFSLPIPIKK